MSAIEGRRYAPIMGTGLVKKADLSRETPLQRAADGRRVEDVLALLELGSDPEELRKMPKTSYHAEISRSYIHALIQDFFACALFMKPPFTDSLRKLLMLYYEGGVLTVKDGRPHSWLMAYFLRICPDLDPGPLEFRIKLHSDKLVAWGFRGDIAFGRRYHAVVAWRRMHPFIDTPSPWDS